MANVRPFPVVIACVGGLLLGVVVSVSVGSLGHRPQRPTLVAEVGVKAAEPPTRAAHAFRPPPPASPMVADTPQNVAPAPAPLREDGKRRLERFEGALRRHSEEPLNPEWSKRATTTLTEALADVAASNDFKLVNVDCRSVTCTGTFEWNTYNKALDRYATILHTSFKPNCYREIILPEPKKADEVYRGTMLVDCQRGEFAMAD